MRRLIRGAVPAVALLASVAAAPQALAGDAAPTHADRVVPGTGVSLSEAGARSAQTRAIAAANPAAVRATATLCGSGYELQFAERLPDARRFGTLFTYTKSSTGRFGACAVFDNNLGTAKHMKLKLCPNKANTACKTDEGTYSQYAGPVKYEDNGPGGWVDCSMVNAIMWSDGIAIIDRQMAVAPCD
ncbi:hypothetical protein ACH47Z_12950 [Streptomyces sp. NPDC020192]|uniref:hypothetical protein n=1 Tax=Streptomyces sp. NPDC020192 TaxID=3365066 RepID=UPI0037AC31B6